MALSDLERRFRQTPGAPIVPVMLATNLALVGFVRNHYVVKRNSFVLVQMHNVTCSSARFTLDFNRFLSVNPLTFLPLLSFARELHAYCVWQHAHGASHVLCATLSDARYRMASTSECMAQKGGQASSTWRECLSGIVWGLCVWSGQKGSIRLWRK